MKVRAGFVSNSSSSSYVVYIPKNRHIDIGKYYEKLYDDADFEYSDYDKKSCIKDTQRCIDNLKKGAVIWEIDIDNEEYCTNFWFLAEIMRNERFILTSLDAQPDHGIIECLNKQQIAQLEELINEDKNRFC